MGVTQLIALIQLKYNNKQYDIITDLLIDMIKDNLDILEISTQLEKLGVENINDVLNAHLDILSNIELSNG